MNSDRILRYGLLGELLHNIEDVKNPKDGGYDLYAPQGVMSLDENMEAAVILMLTDDSDDYMPDFAVEHKLVAVAIYQDVISVVRVARRDKPAATPSDLVAALNYYLDHDAYLHLSKS